MSFKTSLQDNFRRAASNCKYYLGTARLVTCVSGAFLLGWCSCDKLKAILHERARNRKMMLANAKGIDAAPKTYNGKKILTREEANELIGNAIERGEPFMAGRYGSTELNAIWRVRDYGKGFIINVEKPLHNLLYYSGFFPEDKKLLIKFAELMKWATSQVNIMGIWWIPMEEYMLRTYGNNPDYCRLHSLDPLLAPNPWSAKLQGKKVVVIHPFAETIKAQYAKRELLFPDKIFCQLST